RRRKKAQVSHPRWEKAPPTTRPPLTGRFCLVGPGLGALGSADAFAKTKSHTPPWRAVVSDRGMAVSDSRVNPPEAVSLMIFSFMRNRQRNQIQRPWHNN